ncbi:MAG TPA: hypothetical protein VGU71_21610 [Candidatus Dormibacteraeota bacterium]|nr:hypothetical protein [Candidatus Dormibacteraeota bacterium]
MISRFFLALGLAVLMVATGFGSYLYLGGRQSKVAVAPQKPTQASPRPDAFVLPGTLYIAQAGAIYSLSAGRFHPLTPQDGWTQPAIVPGADYLVAVKRSQQFSDVYVVSRFGQVERQLTNNSGPSYDTSLSHWSFYPHLNDDRTILFMSYDEPKYGYDVNLSVWAVPYGGTMRQARLWTNSNDYTGGDMEPIPVGSGLIYTKYDYGGPPLFNLIGQLFLTVQPGSDGRALTSIDDNCLQPSMSPNGHEIAMICTHGKQESFLMIASFDGSTIGPLQAVITDQLVAQPTWAPDGSGIAYLAPSSPAGPFQLWFLPVNAYHPPPPSPIPTPTPTPGGPYSGQLPSPTPSPAPPPVVIKPIQITTNLGFDASSPMAWAG